MNKNAAKINSGIRSLAYKPNEIISGTVVTGSTDTSALTISVQPPDNSEPITGVRLNAVTTNDQGLVLYPQEGSNVVIGSIDGPGEWVLLRASDINKASVKMGSVTYVMDGSNITVQNGNVVFNLSDTLFKMNTASESMHDLLHDLITYITELTVPTPAGNSGIPLNVASFNALLTRLDNLLTA